MDNAIADSSCIVVSLSGGKDSVACLLWGLEYHPGKPILAHHQAMPEDWVETIPYCRELCHRLNVPLIVEQAIYRRELRIFKNGRPPEWQRRMYVLDLQDRDQPFTRADVDDGAICGMVDFAHDQDWPPTGTTRYCTNYFKTELYNRRVREHRGLPPPPSGQLPLTGMLQYAADRAAPPTSKLRWCTAKFKTKVFDSAMRRNRRLLGPRPLTLPGFRRAESPRRAKLPAQRERTAVQLKPGNRDWPQGWRMVDAHPIIDWSRRRTFRYLRDHGVEPHPTYMLQGMTEQEMYDVDEEGGPRCSCVNCIFAHPDHLIAAAQHPPNRQILDATMAFESATGLTWQQRRSITKLLSERKESCP